MTFWIELLSFLKTRAAVPQLYGWFHLFFLGLTLLLTVLFAVLHRNKTRHVRGMLLLISVLLLLLEVYKQIVYSHSVSDGSIVFDYQWYVFPFQFCSTPMYVALLASILGKGRLYNCLCAYLSTYAIFAGLVVMLYPGDVFYDTVGVNVQSMICHGGMIFLGVYLLATGCVKLRHKTILKAMPVFVVLASIAVIANEAFYRLKISEGEVFNMFYFSPHCPPTLPVYSTVQALVPYPFCLFLYIFGFTAAAYIILLISMLIGRLCGRRKKATLV